MMKKVGAAILRLVMRVRLCGIEQCLPALTTNFGAIHCKSDGRSVFGGHCLN